MTHTPELWIYRQAACHPKKIVTSSSSFYSSSQHISFKKNTHLRTEPTFIYVLLDSKNTTQVRIHLLFLLKYFLKSAY